MTVSSETYRSGPYTGNGATTAFDYDFRISDGAHLLVILTTAGVEAVADSADYTVNGVGLAGGGDVTFDTAPANGVLVTIIRDVPFLQELDLENQGAYFAENVETAFDLAVMRDQQLLEMVERSVKIPASSDPEGLDDLVAGIILTLPYVDEISAVAGALADVQTVAANIADIQDAEENADAAAASEAAAAASAALAATYAGDIVVLPYGTKAVFFQAAAPTGWTKLTDAQLNDAALRIVTGAGGGFGGSAAFATAFASRTPAGVVGGTAITEAQMPDHFHQMVANALSGGGALSAANFLAVQLSGGGDDNYVLRNSGATAPTIGRTSTEGSGATHTHGFTGTAMDFAVKYADMIVCERTAP
jgi:hypothetical protein